MHTLSNGRTSVSARPLSHGLRRASSPKGGAKIGPACHCEERSDVAIRFCSNRSKPSHIGSPEQAALPLYKWAQVRSDGAPDGTPPPLENRSKVGQKLWKTRWKVEEN